MTDKWKVLELLLKELGCLSQHNYKYLGMNYSLNPESKRIRFEYIFRNPQTVWFNFSYYPASKAGSDYLAVEINSPFMQEPLDFTQWIRNCSSRLDVSSFNQFDGEFRDKADALMQLLDNSLTKSGLEEVLSGQSGINVPSLDMRV